MRQRQNAIQRASGWLLTVATLLLSALLMLQCLRIYRAGIAPDNLTDTGVRVHAMYSREVLSRCWQQVAWAFWLWLGTVLAAIVAQKYFHHEAQPAMPVLLPEAPALHTGRQDEAVRMVLIVLAVALLALGIANGGMHDVLVKAVNICTECIGLG